MFVNTRITAIKSDYFPVKYYLSNWTLNVFLTQSANQNMHTFNFLSIKIYLKFLKALPHVSVFRPSSGRL